MSRIASEARSAAKSTNVDTLICLSQTISKTRVPIGAYKDVLAKDHDPRDVLASRCGDLVALAIYAYYQLQQQPLPEPPEVEK
jgi:hypothetical protein